MNPPAHAAAGLFAGRAYDYAKARPSYPREAIDLVVHGLKPHAVAIDVGCGTGISTRLLAARGLRVTGVDQAFEGQVRLIGAVIEPSTRLGSVRIELREHRDLRPGAFARGEVETGRGSRPVIPQTSVMSDSGRNYVYLVGADDQVERRDVSIDGSRIEGLVVAAGLTGGERLIKTAGPYLRVGEKVRVAK